MPQKQLTPTQVRNLMIGRALERQRALGLHSRPERLFNDFQLSRNMALLWDRTVDVYDPEEKRGYSYQLDFVEPRPGLVLWDEVRKPDSYVVNFQIDGWKFHHTPTQLSRDKWEDEVKFANGLKKVIHIPEAITKPQHWAYLEAKIATARQSDKRAEYIPG